jgi:hypothetical protein
LKPEITATPGDSVSVTAATSPARPAATPSLEQVMYLLQAQGRELEAVKEELRDQKELTARLAAKLNSAGANPVIAGGAPGPDPSPTIAEASPEPISSSQPITPAGAPQDDLVQRVARLEADLGNSQRNLENRLKAFGPFAFSGDFRLRAEPTFGGPTNQSQDQFRERIRLRFNAEAQLNDQLKGGFSLASGDLNNPISTNETLGQYTTRKPIEIDPPTRGSTTKWFGIRT